MRMIAFHRGARAPEDAAELEQRLRQYCSANYHTWVECLAPDSGYLDDGELDEQYRRLIAMVAPPSGKPALVVMPDAPHLSSDLGVFTERMLELQGFNCDVRCAEPELTDPLQNGQFHLTTDSSETVRKRLSHRAIISRAVEGEVLGRLPYGYRRGANGKFDVEPAEAEVVQRVFRMYTGTDGQPPQGLRRIARALNTEGLRTRHARPWSPVTLSHLLRNRNYTGNYSRYGVKLSGNHPPLVEREQFQKAQDILGSRRPERRRPAQRSHFQLIGLLYCSQCKTKLSGISRRRSWVNEDGTGMERTYRYYECPLKGTSEGHASWNADKLHRQFYQWVAELPKASMKGVLERYNRRREESAAAAKDLSDRRFAEVVRTVSTGHGSMFELEDALERLKEDRAAFAAADGGGFTLPGILPGLEAGAGTAEAQDIARSILSRAVAHRRKVAFTAHA